MKQIELFGTFWDAENINEGYYTYDDAMLFAEGARKQIPSVKEWEKLRDCPSAWEWEITMDFKKGKGRWFAEKEEDLMNPEKSLFLPALGCADKTTSFKWEVFYPFDCYYWSTPFSYSQIGKDEALYFSSDPKKILFSPFDNLNIGYGVTAFSKFLGLPLRCCVVT
jgi:hypothetical protein